MTTIQEFNKLHSSKEIQQAIQVVCGEKNGYFNMRGLLKRKSETKDTTTTKMVNFTSVYHQNAY